MARSFSSDDLARLGSASRVLLSPLAFATVDDWRREAMRAVCDLVGAESATFVLPTEPQAVLGYGIPDDAEAAMDAVLGPISRRAGPSGIASLDALVAFTRQRRPAAWDLHSADAALGGTGAVWDSLWYHEFIVPARIVDINSMNLARAADDVQFTVHGFARAPEPGEHIPMLAALHPSLVAGLDALDRLAAHREALDVLDEPAAFFDADGAETHRTPALRGLLADDPEGTRVARALGDLAFRARPLAFARSGEPAGPAASTHVRTARAGYTLRAVLLAPGGLGGRDAYVVTVAPGGMQTALPAAGVLRERYGLTRREETVVRLVAQGLSNGAVAERLSVSAHTVRHQLEAAMAKLGLSGRGREAVAARLLGAPDA